MTGLYKDNLDRMADVLTANVSTEVCGVMCEGRMRFMPMEPYEREILREERAGAIARLTIDAAMRRPDAPAPGSN